MNPDLLSIEETELNDHSVGSFRIVELSRTEVAINRWIDITEAWLDRYVFTLLLGPNQSALR